ncbi:MAG: hypothetical protein Q4G24_13295 [Paracoccus sp. (in: a-proteobacteria)]|uniref:hypothetical protein n=1 Tax=Paracoccus sp. TaxID=267 RepID=UPI0026DF8E4C|nr:hypothetical protein [Paracoccus sp. (in: a-proteobacteria)]MDO5622434.1 hypothetical protein [Paracoccus sp. (in: a-proteobacteria)]
MIHQNIGTAVAVQGSDNWREAAQIGDIIRWPFDIGAGLGLVVEAGAIAGWRVLSIAPGERDHSQPVGPGCLRLIRPTELRACGLDGPLRFHLSRSISLAPHTPRWRRQPRR